MRTCSFVVLTALFVGPTLSAQQWIRSPVNGHYYALTAPMSWTEAEALAVRWQGHLATIRSKAENDWCWKTFPVKTGLWIGLTDPDLKGKWLWVSGETSTFRNWEPGQPDNARGGEKWAEIDPIAGRWHDVSSRSWPGIVEVKSIPRCTVPGTVAHWRAEGDAKDQAGVHDGTLNGTTFSTGVRGRAFSFDGKDNNVAVPDHADWQFGTREFTIEFWIRFVDAARPQAILAQSNGGNTNDKWILHKDYGGRGNNDLTFHMNGSTKSDVSVPWKAANNRWYYVALTRRASTWTFFVDGLQLDKPQPESEAVPDSTKPLYIGWGGEGPAGHLEGAIDEMAIYKRALTPREIAALFRARGDKCLGGLSSDIATLPASAGGSVSFTLAAPLAHQRKLYLLLGSMSGTSPGVKLGALTLPLKPDAYFSYTLSDPGGLVQRSLNFLDINARGSARLVLPPGLGSPFVGTTMHHAYAVMTLVPFRFDFTSNAVDLRLTK